MTDDVKNSCPGLGETQNLRDKSVNGILFLKLF